MFVSSLTPVLSETLVAALLAALNTRPGAALLATPTLHLYSSVSGPISPASTVSQFTECTFTGYAAVTLSSFVGPILLPNNLGYGILGVGNFLAGSVTPPGQSAVGYWIDDGSTALYLAEQFAAPVPFVSLGNFLELSVIFPIMTPARAQ